MKNYIKNISLIVITLLLSYFTAQYFGRLYDYFVPQYNNSFLGTDRYFSIFVVGIPFSYIFFTIFLFKIFGTSSKNKIIFVMLLPITIFWMYADLYHIYLPMLLGLTGYVFAYAINKLRN